jgi:hypothetical protein
MRRASSLLSSLARAIARSDRAKLIELKPTSTS